MVLRGVPRSLADDAWWLGDEVENGERPQSRKRPLLWGLCAILICADWLVWAPAAGIGFALFLVVLAGLAHLFASPVDRRTGLLAWGVLVASLIPAIELIQALSVSFAIAGLLTFVAILVIGSGDKSAILRVMRRLPLWGLTQSAKDAAKIRVAAPSRSRRQAFFADWALPVGVGAVFISLMASGNPLTASWLSEVGKFGSWVQFDLGRTVFWCLVAALAWPFLRIRDAGSTLVEQVTRPSRTWRSGLINGRSVLRALVLFNLIFAVQSLLDLGYLWGGVALPDGMTYATYAHRGAYPLLATALLAGIFALAAQPFLEGRPFLRQLLYLWVGQNVLLVISSILRLELYVEIYGLTRLRFAAFVWMGLVAAGLALMVVQMMRRQSIGWFVMRSAALAGLALYIGALTNVDGIIARHNMAKHPESYDYTCSLGEGALPAIAAFRSRTGVSPCILGQPSVMEPADWREWGYRNARLRHSLAMIKAERQE